MRLALRALALLLALLMAALCVLPEEAQAQRRRIRDWRLLKRYSFTLGVALTYARRWGDAGERSAFTHAYTLGHRGYIFDPRLAHYRLDLGFSQTFRRGDTRYLGSLRGQLRLFEYVDPRRGLKLWKYVPRPAVIRFSYHKGSTYSSFGYGLSLVYLRPGFLWFFPPEGGVVSYVDELQWRRRLYNYNQNLNRYRLKYNNYNNLNYNRPGNGNGNGNGNSNGNGNGNRNGNGNGNWNLNKNLNLRNLNLNNVNWNLYVRKGWRFNYPILSFDFDQYFYRAEIGTKYNSTSAVFRAYMSNARERSARRFYSAIYRFYYRFMRTDSNGTVRTRHEADLRSRHMWRRLRLDTRMYYKTFDSITDMLALAVLGYSSTYKNWFDYHLALDALVQKSQGITRWQVGGRGFLKRERTVRLSRTERLRYYLMSNYRELQSGQFGGQRVPGRRSYSVRGRVVVTSTRFRWVFLQGSVTSGYSESGIPFSFKALARSRGLRKLTLTAHYTFTTTFPLEHRGLSMSHSFFLRVNYRLRPNLRLQGSARHTITDVRNGLGRRSESTSFEAIVFWRPAVRTSLSLRGRTDINDLGTTYYVSGVLRKGINRRSRLVVRALRRWGDTIAPYSEAQVLYVWSMRRVSLSLGYTLRVHEEVGTTEHSIVVRATRRWARSFRRLW